MNQRTSDNITSIPIAELHCHLEATVEPQTARDLAARHGVDISSFIADGGGYVWKTFEEFLAVYDAISEVIRTPEDYYDLTLAYYRRMAAKGMVYGEVFVSPAHSGRFGMSYLSMINAVAGAMKAAEAEAGIVGRIIVTCVRHYGADQAIDVAKAVYGQPHNYVTGFGIAGDEASGHLEDFKRAFEIAGDAGLGLTAHAGEILGAQSIKDALSILGVSRLGHGVRILEDPELVAYAKDMGIIFEVCPTSNIAIGLYPSLADHPLPDMVEAGLRVTLSSDDPAFFGVDPADEYQRAAHAHGFTRDNLVDFTQTAIEGAFCDNATRSQLLSIIAERR